MKTENRKECDMSWDGGCGWYNDQHWNRYRPTRASERERLAEEREYKRVHAMSSEELRALFESDTGKDTIMRMSGAPNLPSDMEVAIARFADERSWMIADRKDLCEEAKLILAAHPASVTRAELARYHGGDEKIFEVLMENLSAEIRGILALKVGGERLLRLIGDDVENAEFFDIVAESALADGAALSRLIDIGEPRVRVYARRLVAGHNNLRKEDQARVALDAAPEVRAKLAKRADIVDSVSATLSKDVDHWVRADIAANRSVPTTLRMSMVEDDERYVLSALAERDGLKEFSQSALLALAKNENADRFLLEGILKYAIDPLIVSTIAVRGDEQARARCAEHKSASISTIALLLKDEVDYVRQYATAHPSATPSMVDGMVDDKYRFVRAVVAFRTASREVQSRLLSDPDYEVRHSLAQNKLLFEEFAAPLSMDPAPQVRRSLVWNKRTPLEVVASIVDDHDKDVAYSARRRLST